MTSVYFCNESKRTLHDSGWHGSGGGGGGGVARVSFSFKSYEIVDYLPQDL